MLSWRLLLVPPAALATLAGRALGRIADRLFGEPDWPDDYVSRTK